MNKLFVLLFMLSAASCFAGDETISDRDYEDTDEPTPAKINPFLRYFPLHNPSMVLTPKELAAVPPHLQERARNIMLSQARAVGWDWYELLGLGNEINSCFCSSRKNQ